MALDIQPPMPPEFEDTSDKIVMLPPGYPAPPPPMRQYVTTQGDMWDLISLRVFGMRRGDDHLMHELLIAANYTLRNVCRFPAGIAVNIPALVTKTEVPLVPWKKAARIVNPP
jgi:phage tail protein X